MTIIITMAILILIRGQRMAILPLNACYRNQFARNFQCQCHVSVLNNSDHKRGIIILLSYSQAAHYVSYTLVSFVLAGGSNRSRLPNEIITLLTEDLGRAK